MNFSIFVPPNFLGAIADDRRELESELVQSGQISLRHVTFSHYHFASNIFHPIFKIN
jgi:hypothetical protein